MGEQRVPLVCVYDGGAYSSEREEVRKLRMQGLSCARIAELAGIPEEDVASHCRTLGFPETGSCRKVPLPPEDEAWLRDKRGEPKGRKCPVCGNALEQLARGRGKRFCSRECRNKFWNEKRRGDIKIHGHKAVCGNCGEDFYALAETQLFCSRSCYFESRYGRYGRKGEDADGE